jgi:hypothetical protein
VRGRVLFWRSNSTMVEALRLRGRRGGVLVGETMVPMANGFGQIASADVDCGDNDFVPVLELSSAPGVDERGKYAYFFGAGFWRCTAGGQRVPGFGLMQIGEGGWTTTDHLNSFRCTDIGLREYMAACVPPNTFLLHLGANVSSIEAQTLNAGDPSVFKANLGAIMQRYTAAALQAGAAGPIRWLLANPFPMGYTEVNMRTRARAMMELVLADPVNRAFVDLSLLAGCRTGNFPSWYTVDGIHPTPDGAAYLAGLIWSHIAAAA